jgi:cytoskeletal protein RodZ
MIKVGQKFQEARIEKGLTLEEISYSTKIKVSFLEAIEKGDYKRLPSVTYAHGFVRNYARFLNLREKEMLALFRREFDEEQSLKVLPSGLSAEKEFPLKSFRSRQTIFLVFIVFIVLLGYIIFQYRDALVNPSITVSSPLENAVISSSTLNVSGKTDPNATVFVDNYSVSVNTDGNFTKTINVFPGKSTISIKVINRFGKEAVIKRDIEVRPGT